MSSLDRIQVIQKELTELRADFNVFADQITQIQAILSAERFIPKSVSDMAAERLNAVVSVQEEITKQYLALEIGEIPDSVPEIELKLTDRKKSVEERVQYMEGTDFFAHLYSKNTKMQERLAGYQKEAKKLNLEECSLEECREKAEKYVEFKKAFYEENPRKQLSLLIQLGRYFSEDILSAIPYQEIFYEESKENQEEERGKIECATTREEMMEEAKEEPETAEDTDESEMEIMEASEEDDEVLLASIEKYQDELFVKEDSSLLKVEKSPHETKKFGVNNFKNDMKKQYCWEKQICMILAYQDGGMTPESAAAIRKETENDFEIASEKLLQNGYFRKYTVEGYGSFYCLSVRGCKAFSTKESAAFLRQNPYKEEMGVWIEDAANAALVRFLFFQSFLLAREIDDNLLMKNRKTYHGTDYFIAYIPGLKEDKGYLFTGIVSENDKEFCEYGRRLSKFSYLPQASHVVFMALTDRQGEKTAWWMEETFKDCFDHKAVYYWSYQQKERKLLFDRRENRQGNAKDPKPDQNADKELSDGKEDPPGEKKAEEKRPFVKPKRIAAEKREALSSDQKAAYIETYQKMICQDKPYCAAAYLSAAARQSSDMEWMYSQLAYALNDPMQNCSYRSEKLFSVYFHEIMPVSEYFVVSAILRNYFYDQYNYDFSLPQLQDAVKGFSILSENTALNRILYTLKKFKEENGNSVDRYADYRERERTAWEKNFSDIQKEAKDYFDNYVVGMIKENASNRRFVETKKLLFSRDDHISTYLRVVMEDDRAKLSSMEDFLRKTYIKDNEVVRGENIDPEKIHSVLDRYWIEAGKNMRLIKKTSDLMSSLRMNLYKMVSKGIEILCQYVCLVHSSMEDENDGGFVAYRKICSSLIQMMDEAVSDCQADNSMDSLEELCGKKVLSITLHELRARLDGSYEDGSNRYFYLNFLKNDKVHLDDAFLPVLDDVFELPDLSACKRIEQHFAEPERTLEERMEEITRGNNDDFGTAALILRYAGDEQRNSGFRLKGEYDIERDLPNIEADAKNKRNAFIEDLELAQSYGQIDNTEEDKKETIIQIMDSWYLWAFETHNYGFFQKILRQFMEKIKRDSQSRAVELEGSLCLYLEKNKEEKNSKVLAAVEQVKQRIENQNYAAAEDLLNRLVADDLDAELDLNQEDYLMQFLGEHDLHYRRTANPSITLRSILSAGRTNKDTKGGARLLDNWLRRSGVGEEKIQDLLNSLGFQVDQVKLQSAIQGKIENYIVKLKRPQNGRKSNYKHPIAAFGSQAETEGFRVVCLFGKMDAGRLLDTFKEIGNAKNTLIFLDYSLPLADRRELARKIKIWGSGKIFAVADRVVLAYLVNHYVETSVNRMLMAVIMPFASYQPYIFDSANIMPPEIFIGRKYELEKIESPTGVNIVYGGRQLGKSALLRMAKNDIDRNENGDRAIIIDIKDLDEKRAARKISTELFDEGIVKKENITEDWQILARDIKNRLRDETDKVPYLLLMLDEADVFIDSCEQVKYQPLDALKDIQSVGAGRFKFVIAGLRNIVRFKKNIALGSNSVLTHLESLTITPFKSTEARELLETPLSYLGFRFPRPETDILVSTIFGTTNYFPGLLQLYCSKLIETMKKDYANYTESETPPYIVQEEQIKKVLAEQGLQQQIREKFFITLKVDEDDYYYIIALIIASCYHQRKQQNGCSAEDIFMLAEELSIKKITNLGEEKILALMEEMRELNILQHVGDGRYRFARYSFCQMMGTVQQIEDEILHYMED